MIELHHTFAYDREDTRTFGCVCGSAWNFIADGCVSLYPFETRAVFERVEDDFDRGDFFECRKGHAMCGRH